MQVQIHRCNVEEGAFVSLPSSKSLSHRALITASLADGISVIHGVAISKDIEATIYYSYSTCNKLRSRQPPLCSGDR